MECKFLLNTCSNLNNKLHSSFLCKECINGNNYEHIDNFKTIIKQLNKTEMEINFKTKVYLSSSNSYGIVREKEEVDIEVCIGVQETTCSGYFEFYDINSGGEEWYAEGSLEFSGMVLNGYDGIFELPNFIIDKLKELGYTINL